MTLSRVPADVYDEAVEILDAEGSVDLDERASAWRQEGWTSGPATGGLAASGAGLAGSDTADRGRRRTRGDLRAAPSLTAASAPQGVSATRRTIPVVEEQLRVGKRDVELGRVRVRSYVVEEPVSEEVRLHEDRVEVERRPVDRPLGAAESAFVDRTIEAEEHAEEAIVSKEARVTEEIGLRRESTEHTETVSDRVRHTEVEVEDDREPASPDEVTRRGA